MSFQQGLSGLNSSAKQLDTIGNNVANASTVGFKQSQAQFSDMYAASLAGAGAVQIGTGAKLAAVAQQFTQGNVTNTNNPMDTAISGQGFFRMVDTNGAIFYSRNGQFQVDKNGFIVNNQGHQVSGYVATAGVIGAAIGPLQMSTIPVSPKQTAAVGVTANLDSRAVFPSSLISANVTGNAAAGLRITNVPTAGQYAAAISVGGPATNFTVDGFAMALTASPGNMATAASIAAALQVQLNAAAAGVYAVSSAANTVTIAKVATGAGSLAPVIAGADANAIAAGFTAGTSTNGLAINNTMTATVDGVLSGTVTIPTGTYATPALLASAVQTAVNADPALLAAGKSVTVTADATGKLIMTANSAGPTSGVVVAGLAVADLFGAAPVTTLGSGVFNPTLSTTYNNSTSLTVYDIKGTPHIASLYFQKVSPSIWNTYLTIDGAQIPATGNVMATLNFSTAGKLLTAVPTAPATQGVNVKAVISDGSYTPLGANPMPIPFDFANMTQFGGNFGVSALTQDGYSFGQLNGFSTSADGTILGRYSNGQTQALGQMALANFTNPQGLQPMGNNEWVETSASGNPLVGRPGSSSLGVLQSSAVEDSNVDLTAELVSMITAQRVYQANAQTIKAQDQVLQTLVNLR